MLALALDAGMRAIKWEVGAVPGTSVKTWAYPNGLHLGAFLVPSYKLKVTGTTDSDAVSTTVFDVLRFGVICKDGTSASIVGLAHYQTHTIKGWIPTYVVHSANSPENGAWQVYEDFLIHDGPDGPGESFASIGCVEIMGLQGFVKFNDLLISLSGIKKPSRGAALGEIGKSRQLSITYQAASRPPLVKVP